MPESTLDQIQRRIAEVLEDAGLLIGENITGIEIGTPHHGDGIEVAVRISATAFTADEWKRMREGRGLYDMERAIIEEFCKIENTPLSYDKLQERLRQRFQRQSLKIWESTRQRFNIRARKAGHVCRLHVVSDRTGPGENWQLQLVRAACIDGKKKRR